jgi:hypothetical protein
VFAVIRVKMSEKTVRAIQHGGRLQMWLFVALCWLVPDLKLNYANAINGDLALVYAGEDIGFER